MCWFRTTLLLLLAGNACADRGDYAIGGGAEGDSADGLAVAAMIDYAVADATWLSASLARNTADLPLDLKFETWYADVGIDHWLGPFGLRAGVAYWGDADILDSRDYRASAYWRTKTASFSLDYKRRDFELDIPGRQFFPRRSFDFFANGIGASASFDIGDKASLSFNGMSFDYSVDLAIDENAPIRDLLGVSRLGLLNSLVEYRFGSTLGLDAGDSRWSVSLARWKGAVDQGVTDSVTVRFLTPLGDSTDVEFGLGRDSSESYGDVTFFSIFLYFYGGS
jgi:hypothetical protein